MEESQWIISSSSRARRHSTFNIVYSLPGGFIVCTGSSPVTHHAPRNFPEKRSGPWLGGSVGGAGAGKNS